MARTIRCTIVTPTESLFDDQVLYASVPAWDGQIGVMPGQSPVLTRLGIGGLRLSLSDGTTQWFLIDGGFAQVQRDTLTLLTDGAIPAASLSREDAEAALSEANAQVTRTGQDQQKVSARQRRAMAMMAVLASSS